jgi:hypothetical protein
VVKPDGRTACCVATMDYPNESGLYAALSLLDGQPNAINLERLIMKY